MEAETSILAIIPARGGSKGVPQKNIVSVAGKPLIAYSISQARATPGVNRVVVSTDDSAIAEVSRAYGAEVVQRPPELCSDTAPSETAILHVLDSERSRTGIDPSLVVFLQCTSPVRRDTDIRDAIESLRNEGADSLLSVHRFHTFMWKRDAGGTGYAIDYDYRKRPRRQDREPEFVENGSLYVIRPHVLRHHNNRLGGRISLFEMDQFSQVDINEPEDVLICGAIIQNLRDRPNYQNSLRCAETYGLNTVLSV